MVLGSRFTEQRHSTAEVMLGLVQIVRAAALLKILDSRRTASSVGPDVVKLKKASFRAAALGADRRAPAAVPFPYCSPDVPLECVAPPATSSTRRLGARRPRVWPARDRRAAA